MRQPVIWYSTVVEPTAADLEKNAELSSRHNDCLYFNFKVAKINQFSHQKIKLKASFVTFVVILLLI